MSVADESSIECPEVNFFFFFGVVVLLLLLWASCRGIPVCERIGKGKENRVKLEGDGLHS